MMKSDISLKEFRELLAEEENIIIDLSSIKRSHDGKTCKYQVHFNNKAQVAYVLNYMCYLFPVLVSSESPVRLDNDDVKDFNLDHLLVELSGVLYDSTCVVKEDKYTSKEKAKYKEDFQSAKNEKAKKGVVQKSLIRTFYDVISHLAKIFPSYEFNMEFDFKIHQISVFAQRKGSGLKFKGEIRINNDFNFSEIKNPENINNFAALKTKMGTLDHNDKYVEGFKTDVMLDYIYFGMIHFILEDIVNNHLEKKGKKQWQHWKWNASTTMRHA